MYGKNFDVQIAASSLVALKGALENNEHVRQSAKANSQRDFTNTVDDGAGEHSRGPF